MKSNNNGVGEIQRKNIVKSGKKKTSKGTPVAWEREKGSTGPVPKGKRDTREKNRKKGEKKMSGSPRQRKRGFRFPGPPFEREGLFRREKVLTSEKDKRNAGGGERKKRYTREKNPFRNLELSNP